MYKTRHRVAVAWRNAAPVIKHTITQHKYLDNYSPTSFFPVTYNPFTETISVTAKNISPDFLQILKLEIISVSIHFIGLFINFFISNIMTGKASCSSHQR